MIRIVSALFVLGVSMTVVGPVLAADGVQELDEKWKTHMIAGDLDAVLGLYDADAMMALPGEAVARGADAIRTSYRTMLSTYTVTGVTFTNTHYETSGKLSAGWGEGTLTLAPKAGGDPVVLSFRYTAVARKKDGKWVYVNDHASAQPEGAPAAAPSGGDDDDDDDGR